jgi:hypothetical protein
MFMTVNGMNKHVVKMHSDSREAQEIRQEEVPFSLLSFVLIQFQISPYILNVIACNFTPTFFCKNEATLKGYARQQKNFEYLHPLLKRFTPEVCMHSICTCLFFSGVSQRASLQETVKVFRLNGGDYDLLREATTNLPFDNVDVDKTNTWARKQLSCGMERGFNLNPSMAELAERWDGRFYEALGYRPFAHAANRNKNRWVTRPNQVIANPCFSSG